VFVDDLDVPTLGDADAHHLRRVLRLRDGDALSLSDGHGRWRPAVLRIHGDRLELADAGAVHAVAKRTPAVTIGFALVKGSRPELVVQKLTELGVDRIVPFEAERSVVQWDEARARHHEDRLARVAREAAMQCHRCWLPAVERVTTFAALVAEPGAAIA